MKPNLQAIRKRAGFSSAVEFANHVGISPRTYTNYEQGTRQLTLAQAWEFADILGCSIDEIAGRPAGRRSEYVDDGQRIINMEYEKLNDSARRRAVENVVDMASNPANLIVKCRQDIESAGIERTA